MKESRDNIVDPLKPVVPEDLQALMMSFTPDFRADELVIQVVSMKDDDPEGDRPHFEVVERLDGIVVGAMLEDVEIEGGENNA